MEKKVPSISNGNELQYQYLTPTKITFLYLFIFQIEFDYKSLVLNMFDVCVQRFQCKKGIHCFDETDRILFVNPLFTLRSLANHIKHVKKLLYSTSIWIQKKVIFGEVKQKGQVGGDNDI